MSEQRYYLQDLGRELVLLAQQAQPTTHQTDDSFQLGRRTALYEVLSLLKQQAVSFGLEDRDIGLEGINIDDFNL